jgi:hypothetical protein
MILNEISKKALMNREIFDPKNDEHLKITRSYFKENKWGTFCPFFLEWPYTTVPEMLKDKITRHFLFK